LNCERADHAIVAVTWSAEIQRCGTVRSPFWQRGAMCGVNAMLPAKESKIAVRKAIAELGCNALSESGDITITSYVSGDQLIAIFVTRLCD
jgi:hypothetical protein